MTDDEDALLRRILDDLTKTPTRELDLMLTCLVQELMVRGRPGSEILDDVQIAIDTLLAEAPKEERKLLNFTPRKAKGPTR